LHVTPSWCTVQTTCVNRSHVHGLSSNRAFILIVSHDRVEQMGANEGDLSTGILQAQDIFEDGLRWIVCLVSGGLNERKPASSGIL